MLLTAGFVLALTDQVLVTEYADTPFSVISPLRRLDDGRTLYKLFSPEPIRHLLRDIFGHHEVVRVDTTTLMNYVGVCLVGHGRRSLGLEAKELVEIMIYCSIGQYVGLPLLSMDKS